MTTFTDGPAMGQSLMLGRAPMFLRVTEINGKFDALDQLDDTAEPGEILHVYILKGASGSAFIDGADPKTGKRWGRQVVIAVYAYYKDQPPQTTMTDNKQWAAWATETGTKLMTAKESNE